VYTTTRLISFVSRPFYKRVYNNIALLNAFRNGAKNTTYKNYRKTDYCTRYIIIAFKYIVYVVPSIYLSDLTRFR